MPRPTSGTRIARSYVTPVGTTTVSREIDFQLGAREGIEIFAAIGTITLIADNGASGFVGNSAHHTLHLETGSLETIPDAAGEDEDTTDSEIFWRQDITMLTQDEAATRGGSAAALLVMPNGIVQFPTALFSGRNLTHSGVGLSATWGYGMHVTIYYRFVEFTLPELGLILARRQ